MMADQRPESEGGSRITATRISAWLAGGLAGAAPAVIAWVIATYQSGYQVLPLAFAIGILSGLGVRAAARQARGAGPAAVALVAGVLAMGAAKAGHFVASWPRDRQGNALTQLSSVIQREHERAGQPVYLRSFGWLTIYPPEIRAEAEARWQALEPEERAWILAGPARAALLDRESVIARWASEIAGEPAAADLKSREDYSPEAWRELVARWQGLTPEERRAFEKRLGDDLLWDLVLFQIFSVVSLWDVLVFFPAAATTAFLVGFGLPTPAARRASAGLSLAMLTLLALASWAFLALGAKWREQALSVAEPTVGGPAQVFHSTGELSFRCAREWALQSRSESSGKAEIVLSLGDRNTIGVAVDAGGFDLATRITELRRRLEAPLEACEVDWELSDWGRFPGPGMVLRCLRDREPVRLKLFASQVGPAKHLLIYALYPPDQEVAVLEAEYANPELARMVIPAGPVPPASEG